MTTNHVHVITQAQKNPRACLFRGRLSGIAPLKDAILDSVATLEVVFEPIVHKTSDDVRNDSLYEIEHHAHD